MPLTPSGTREVLKKLGHEPKRFLGQNFLVDGNIVRKSLELGDVKAGDVVVEVGPGLGTLTSALLEAGAEVWAVEKDRQLHAHLTETLVPTHPEKFHLLEGDAMEHPIADLPTDKAASFKIVANLPYAIATPWLDEVLSGPLPARMVLMLQQEAAQRYVAQPDSKSFGAISIALQAAYDVAPGHKVGSGCFYPPPDIESYLLHLARKPAPYVFDAKTKAVIRACFQQRRKQIGGLLRGKVSAENAAAWCAELTAAGLGPSARPEQIPVSLWQKLAV
ncbi:16S rRNA (adenine(1518)-N(6)/adenine(1519)-N(6))-dimethyltransferase RsmA [Oleiharenicola lentus]|uniref:16S rRNA (adenine(1518)-N(6)/adenine(1519)-N(6))- dimethyltransferase RsmA n=1 Tax=Oleiharenicola lentus TaxID=2508720 RepID=UPI003F6727AB